MPLKHGLLGAALLLFAAAPAQAQAAANCTLANVVDSATYDLLTITNWSEVDQDESSYNWAQCRAAKLDKDLATQPQLRARLQTLRRQYREMRAIEGQLAGIRAGGGTMYVHQVPRMYPFLEEQLGSLGALARSTLGAPTGQHYARVIAEAKADHASYLKLQRAYKPGPDEDYVMYDPKTWATTLNRYDTLGKAIMLTLGNRNDAATALGYSILTHFTFSADPEEYGY
ncbi:hypothetical protein [Deinococcus puniceus]|uniref:DUF885 domain-containing protein n=1 Tax=Deinococcus puniceus TaxID=1182568 RepID=A0A172T9U5_9DEIO|nr:hypothetical protein [Deinococcus puniceus]ANE43724.1 hypothetical protein SU48_08035 [Deinococcus puniceus]